MPDNPAGSLPSANGIGALRWKVSMYRRLQDPGPHSAISESFIPIVTVRADVQPTYPTTFAASAEVDAPITHLIRARWLDYVENTYVIFRTTKRPDETFRTELFRVRRVKEIAGRKRFVEIEVELEKVKTTQGDSDEERELLFAENPVRLN
ncbi:MAG TPA: head-tail adaptor protein [Xanthobacteraceae bacterium]|nr:head-tail adaptor protein [Xanthobacteraceae bacterium]